MADRITANLPAKDLDATERFYARLARLDKGWRESEMPQVPAIRRLRERLGGMVG